MNKICLMPFVRLNLTRFYLYPCCDTWIHNHIKFQSSGIYKDTYWDSMQMNLFRESILNGSYKYCLDTCPFKVEFNNEQNHLIKSFECIKNDTPLIANAIQSFIDTGYKKYELNPVEIGLSYDPTCNLQCPSCRSKQLSMNVNYCNLHESRSKIYFKDAEVVYIAGDGDPFASSYYFGLLKNDIREKFPNAKSIYIQTNGILFNESNWNKIHEFNRSIISQVSISIDACENSVYKLVRGNHFNTLISNLEFIKQLKNDTNITTLITSFTINSLNYSNVIPFIEFAKKYSFNKIEYWSIKNWIRNFRYNELAIHQPSHPLYNEYIKVINALEKIDDNDINILKGYDRTV